MREQERTMMQQDRQVAHTQSVQKEQTKDWMDITKSQSHRSNKREWPCFGSRSLSQLTHDHMNTHHRQTKTAHLRMCVRHASILQDSPRTVYGRWVAAGPTTAMFAELQQYTRLRWTSHTMLPTMASNGCASQAGSLSTRN